MMSVGGSLRRGRGLWALLVVGLILGWVAGCTQLGNLWPGGNADPSGTVDDASLGMNPSDDGTTASSCGLNMLVGADHDAAVQAATNNPKVQNIQQELSTRGVTVQANGALAFSIDSEKLVYLPAGDTAGIVAETYLGQWYAVGLVKEGDKTTNIRPDRGVRHLTGFDPKTRAQLFKSLRTTSQVKNLEKTLKKQNQLIDWNKSVLIVDTENNQATVGFAIRATDNSKPAWFGYRVEATLLKGDKLSVQNIKAETCATLATAAPIGVQPSSETKPQFYDGEPTPGGSYDQTQVCVSSWGYNYYCFNSTPQFGVSAVSSPLAAFVNTSVQTTFTIWNYSNTTMSGTVTTAAPFSIVSGGTFTNLAPGQPQTVVVKFSPTASGNYTGNIALTSGSVVQNVAVSAYTLTVTPARLDFTTIVGGSQNQVLTVKNDGPGPVYNDLLNRPPTPGASSSVTLSTTAPYSINPASFTVTGQNSTQVTIGYAPSTAGSFPGSVHLVSGQSSMDLPLGGSTYQVSLNPAQPNLSAFVGGSGQQKVALMNTSPIPVTLTPSMTAPFSIVSPTGAITLAANQSVDLTLQFSPTAAGTFTGNLHLVSSASASKDFVITGTTQALSISSAELVFPGTFVNSAPQQTMTVTNTGLTQVSFNASAIAPFSVVSPTGTVSLAPNQSVNLAVQFKPTAAGTYAGNVALASGSFVQNVAVTGWTLSLSPAQLNPDTTFIGNPAPQQTLVVKNDGPAPDSLDAINLGKRGTTTAKLLGQAAQFNVGSITALTAAGTPAYSVDPTSCSLYGQHSCQLKVKFIPTESGVFAGNISLNSANGGITSSSNLGVNGTAYKISVNPVWNSFGLVFIDPTGEIPPTVRESIITLTNLGTTAITLQFDRSAPPANSPFAVIGPGQNPMVLAPTSTVKFQVQFSPTESGFYSETIKIVVGSVVPGVPENAALLNAGTFYIPFEGLAMTVEEYIKKIKDAEASGDLESAALFAGGPSSDTGILYAGMLDGLNLQRMRLIEQMYTNPQNDADAAEQWKQIEKGIAIFQSIDPNAIERWVSTLRNALESGGQVAYQAAHDQLFSSDDEYVKYIAANLLMQGRISLPPEIQLGTDQTGQIIRDFLVKFFAGLAASAVSARLQDPSFHCAADEATCNLEYNFLVFWRDTLHNYFSQEVFDQLKRNWDYLLTNAGTLLNGQELKAISYAIFRIAQSIVTFVQHNGYCVPELINCHPQYAISSVANYLLWAVNMSLPGLPGSSVNPQIRLQEVVGTLLALGVLALQGWHMHGIASDGKGWWGGLAYLPNSPGDGTPNYDKNIVLVIRGDHCTDCAAQAAAIAKWVIYALQYIHSAAFKVMYNDLSGPHQPIITIFFTNTNATGIATVLVSLQIYSLQDVPIVVIWFEKDANGNWGVQIRCIGLKCQELEAGGVIKKLQDDYFWALQQALKAYPGQSPDSAWWLNYGACGGDADCIKFIAEQTARWLNGEIGPPPEPECGPNGCDPAHH